MRWPWRQILIFVIVSASLTVIFVFNPLETGSSQFFQRWDQFSEDFAYSSVLSQRNEPPSPYGFVNYVAQLGLVGHILEIFAALTGIDSLFGLRVFTAMLTSIAVTAIGWTLSRVSNRLFAGVYLSALVLSPWFVAAASNLYWAPWTWLLPSVAAGLFAIAKSRRMRVITLCFVYLAFILRFASGYEFMTAFILLAVTVTVLPSLLSSGTEFRIRKQIMDALQVGGMAIAAFLTVLLVHANLRGNGSPIVGLANIWKEDVLRRTYGSANDFGMEYAGSLQAGPFKVLKIYLFNWETNLLEASVGTPFTFVLNSSSLIILIVFTALAIAFMWRRTDSTWVKRGLFVALSAAVPISWFVLAKSHSFIHTHINFVLWYLAFIPALLYVCLEFVFHLTVVRRSVQAWKRFID